MHPVYSHLKRYGLANKASLRQRVSTLSEKRFTLFFDQYVKLCQQISLNSTPLPGVTDIYPDSRSLITSPETIRRLAIYANRIYVHDELLALALEWPEIDGMHQLAQMPDRKQRVSAFQQRLVRCLEFLLDVKAFVNNGIVVLLPTESFYPRRRFDSIYADDFYGSDPTLLENQNEDHPLLSEEMRQYLQGQIKLQFPTPKGAATPIGQGGRYPNMMRIVLGENDTVEEFRFFDIKLGEGFGETGHITMFHSRDPYGQEIDGATFQNWIKGSSQKVIIKRVERLYDDLAMARHAKARFLTDLPLSRGLLHAYAQPAHDIHGILNMNLPFFDNVDTESVVKGRKNEVAFHDFRLMLEKAIRAIPLEQDPETFQARLDELSRDMLYLPLLKIEREQKRLQRNLFAQGWPKIGTLALSWFNPALAIPGALLALGTSLMEMADKNRPSQDKIEEMPSYFYWSVAQKSMEKHKK